VRGGLALLHGFSHQKEGEGVGVAQMPKAKTSKRAGRFTANSWASVKRPEFFLCGAFAFPKGLFPFCRSTAVAFGPASSYEPSRKGKRWLQNWLGQKKKQECKGTVKFPILCLFVTTRQMKLPGFFTVHGIVMTSSENKPPWAGPRRTSAG